MQILGLLVTTAGSDTIFIQIIMGAPPGVPGVLKIHKNIVECPQKTNEFPECITLMQW